MAVDLSIGGQSWAGWHFGPWGRAKEWRLRAPNEQTYLAGELLEFPQLLMDLNALQVQLRTLEALASPDAMHFGPADAALLIAAKDVIERASKQLGLYRARRARDPFMETTDGSARR